MNDEDDVLSGEEAFASAVSAFRLEMPDWDRAEAIALGLAEALKRIKLGTSQRDTIALCLASSIVEAVFGVIVLCRTPGASHALSVARAGLDAYVDLRLLVKDPAHRFAMEKQAAVNQQRAWRRMLKDAEKVPTLAARVPVLKQRIRAAERRIEAVPDGTVVLRAQQKMEAVDLEDAYWVAWYHFGAGTHNDLDVLISRHLRPGGVRLGEGLRDHAKAMVVHGMAAIAFSAIHCLLSESSASAEGLVSLDAVGRLIQDFGVRMPRNPDGEA